MRISLTQKDPELDKWADDECLQAAHDAILADDPNAAVDANAVGAYNMTQAIRHAAEQAEDSDLGLSRFGLLYHLMHVDYTPRPTSRASASAWTA